MQLYKVQRLPKKALKMKIPYFEAYTSSKPITPYNVLGNIHL
jgi:hypothetical protein